MKAVGVILLLGLLSGCAMSAGQMGHRDISQTWYSDRPAVDVSGCMAQSLNGNNNSFQQGTGHYVLTRISGYGIPYARWDFIEEGDGRTRVELRKTPAITHGEGDIEGCL